MSKKKFSQSSFTVVVSTEVSHGTYFTDVNRYDMHGAKRSLAALVECAVDQAKLMFVEECGIDEDEIRVNAVMIGQQDNLYFD